MTVIIEQPLTKKEHRILIGIGISVFSAIIFVLINCKIDPAWLSIICWIATGIGITGFILSMKYTEVKG